jgi:hypothetical protein
MPALLPVWNRFQFQPPIIRTTLQSWQDGSCAALILAIDRPCFRSFLRFRAILEIFEEVRGIAILARRISTQCLKHVLYGNVSDDLEQSPTGTSRCCLLVIFFSLQERSMLAEAEPSVCTLLNEAERTAVRHQLEKILNNSLFSHSRRFPSFLRFIVEGALSSCPDLLKERTLGIEIFGRAADYDTGSDPIVRVTAAEIRKRITLYYLEPGHEAELRIEIPRGTYVPRFSWPLPEVAAVPARPLPSASIPDTSAKSGHPRRFWTHRRTAGLIGSILLAAASVVFLRAAGSSSLDIFWAPVFSSSAPLVIWIADQDQYPTVSLHDADDPSRQMQLTDRLTTVAMEELGPVMRIEDMLDSHGRRVILRAADTTSIGDLRHGPNLFIGSFENPWTLRLTRPLRYRFFNDAGMTRLGIIDSDAPSDGRWIITPQSPASGGYRDFALVARFSDSTTGRLTIVAAGVTRESTVAAGNFLMSARGLAALTRLAPHGKTNLEAVLSTQVVNGTAGPLKIESTYFW